MLIGVNARFLEEPMTGRGVFLARLLEQWATHTRDRFLLFVPRLDQEIEARCAGLPVVEVPPPESGGHTRGTNWDRHFVRHARVQEAAPEVLFQPYFRIPVQSGPWRLVLTVHDLINLEYLNLADLVAGRFPWKLLSTSMLADRLLDPRRIRQATRVATVSQHAATSIERILHYPRDQVQVIPNGIDPVFAVPLQKPVLHRTLKRYGLTIDGYLLYVGGMIYRKNLGRLATAYNRLPPELRQRYPLVLTGSGYWERRLKKRNQPGLIFPGRVPQQDLPALFAGCRAFVYPSLAEGFGLPLLEAGLAGAAVGAPNRSVHPEIAGDFARLFDPFDTAAIRDTLIDLLHSPERFRLSPARRHAKLDSYSWKKAAQAYLQLFRAAARD